VRKEIGSTENVEPAKTRRIMRYKKLGFIRKKHGLQEYEFDFDYSSITDETVEVYVKVDPIHRPKREKGIHPGIDAVLANLPTDVR
jgi:hypothetical protein